MSGVPNSEEIFNAREELVSGDLMRAQALISRDSQNTHGEMTRAIDSTVKDPVSPANLLTAVGTHIGGMDLVPTLTAAGGFTMSIGAGAGFFYYNTGIGVDDSPHLVVRWAAQTLPTFATPDATNPRIDVVVATPVSVNTDPASRNILVDPVARTVTAATVNKSANPVATLSLVTGTPSATPAVPAVAAGSMAVFYVWVPAAAASSGSFAPCRAAWRRAPYPFSAMTTVLSGMGIKWNISADPTAASASMTAKGFHRIAIDGEVMEFVANMDSTAGGVVQDTTANPFASPAPAGWNKPYYIYAVGGRHNPLPSFNTSDHFLSPVTLVESTIAPNLATGKPSTFLLPPVGGAITDGAVYIGLGFVIANSTRRAACLMDGTWTYTGLTPAFSSNKLSHTAGSANFEAMATGGPAVVPTISTRAKTLFSTSATATFWTVAPDDGTGAAVSPQFTLGQIASGDGTALAVVTNGEIEWAAGGTPPTVWVQSTSSTGTANLIFLAFDHRVGRVGMHVNP